MLAQGTHFTFSINGTRVGVYDDASLPTGVVGVTISPGGEVVFTDFHVKTL